MSHFTDILELLHDLEKELSMLSLWEDVHPGEEAILSQMPFAVDTLTPQQWLQWIFIPRMHRAISLQSLPSGFEITPYFEECWKDKPQMNSVILILKQIDKACQ